MGILRMEHIGIVVEDLPAAIEFFVELGLEPRGEGSIEGEWVGRIIGLEDVSLNMAMLRVPGGQGEVELIEFKSPPAEDGKPGAPANATGFRHLAFAVDDIDAAVAGLRARGSELVGEVVSYDDSWRLCYVRGPEGIVVELAEKVGGGAEAAG